MNGFKVLVLFIFLLGMVVYGDPGGEGLDRDLQRGFDSIRPMEVYNYCKVIASAEHAGRLTGHEGYTKAARWAAGKFKEWGLLPINDGGEVEGYLQAYPSPYTVINEAAMSLFAAGGTGQIKEIKLEPGKDFLPILYSDSGNHRAGLVFAGWGISAPELGYDDYAGVEVRGKFILCFRGTPDRRNRDFEPYDHHRQRMKTARDKGALGLFYIYPEALANPNGDWLEGFTPAIITEEIGDMILKEKGLNSEDLKRELQSSKKPRSFALHSEIDFMVKARHFAHGIGYNIAGYVAGRDPQLNEECLVMGGHFDHCGLHMGFHFAGANDNGSGSAVVMEVAQAFSTMNVRPKRSVVFVLFGGEEKGLEGSYYFADHLPAPFKKTDTMLNFDMVGEGDGTGCGISKGASALKEALEQADEYVHTLRRSRWIERVGVRSSDYAPFFLQGAACISFYSNGPHLHYHKTGDTIYRINPDMLADVARLAFLTTFNRANR
jgi:hypothetical protein